MTRRRNRVVQARSTATAAARPTNSTSSRRVVGVDVLRGFALCLMLVYHFAFDLRFYGVTSADFEHDPFWLGFRALIVTLFLGLVGVSLVLAERKGASREHFWRRVGVIALCAIAASAGSWIAFPTTYIYFGILHCIAVASVVAMPFVRRPAWSAAIGATVIVAGLTFAHAAFDSRALSWIGFTTAKPATEDYVPLFPWAGVVFLGIAAGHALSRSAYAALRPLAATSPWLAAMGRHSLVVYMIHQPLLLGLLWIVVR